MNKKLLYEVPEAELLVLRFEKNIMSGGIPDITDPDDDSENWG